MTLRLTLSIVGKFDLGPVYLTVWLRDFGGETRQCRLYQHDISTDVAKLLPTFQLFYILAARWLK